MTKAIFDRAVIAENTARGYRSPMPKSAELAEHFTFYPVVTIER